MLSTSPPLYDVKKILCQKFAATRTTDELELIQRFLIHETELNHDQLWRILPQSQKLQLCGYFRYNQVNEDHIIHLKHPANKNSSVKILILVKGSGLLVCGDHSLPLHSCHGRNPCLGAIPIPQGMQKLINISLQEENLQRNTVNKFDTFMQNIHKGDETSLDIGRPSILLQKGSHYIYLNCLDCQLFMERLFDRQISQRVLHRFKCSSLWKQNSEFLTFPKDQPIILEGWGYDKIILTIRGKCQLSTNLPKMEVENDDENKTVQNSLKYDEASESNLKISEVGPMTFLAFLPYFVDEVNVQPITVTALTRVRILVLDANELIHHLKPYPTIFETFQDLSRRQIQWLNKTIEKIILKMQQERQPKKLHEDYEEDDEDFPSSSIEEIENIINIKTKKNPKLSKHKLIKEFKRLVHGDEKCEEVEEYEDLFLRFDFKDECMREIEEIMGQNWETNDNEEESDLTPFPSILISRKLHGKTLPNVKQSNGYLNPFEMKNSGGMKHDAIGEKN